MLEGWFMLVTLRVWNCISSFWLFSFGWFGHFLGLDSLWETLNSWIWAVNKSLRLLVLHWMVGYGQVLQGVPALATPLGYPFILSNSVYLGHLGQGNTSFLNMCFQFGLYVMDFSSQLWWNVLTWLLFDIFRLTDVELKLKLHDLAIKESVPTASRLEKLKWQPKQKGCLFIPLCWMMSLPVVRSYLKNDVSQLAIHFMSDGYMEGNGLFYVALQDNHGHTNDITPNVMAKWSSKWKDANEEFENKLLEDDDLKIFSYKMFMVWDGNHRLQAWMPIIEQVHTHDIIWHFCVEAVILDPRGDAPSMIAALHEVNW